MMDTATAQVVSYSLRGNKKCTFSECGYVLFKHSEQYYLPFNPSLASVGESTASH
jgi:hypothetical protein